MSPETLAILSAIANAATALGALAAAWQLYLVHRQSITNFEDSFAKEYSFRVAPPDQRLEAEKLFHFSHVENPLCRRRQRIDHDRQ